jgi:integrase
VTGLAPEDGAQHPRDVAQGAGRRAAQRGPSIRNVAALADPPISSAARKRPDIKAWDADQLVEFLDAIEATGWHRRSTCVAHTGMRRGEVLGLRWGDLDLDAGRVSVRQALVSVALSDVDLGREDGDGRRTIDIDDEPIEVLRDVAQASNRGTWRYRPGDDDLVFVKPDGTWIHPDMFSQLFDRDRCQARRPGDHAARPAPHPCHPAAEGWCAR